MPDENDKKDEAAAQKAGKVTPAATPGTPDKDAAPEDLQAKAEDRGKPTSLGERLQRVQEEQQLETRPATHPGIKSGGLVGDYAVHRELRTMWPLTDFEGDEED